MGCLVVVSPPPLPSGIIGAAGAPSLLGALPALLGVRGGSYVVIFCVVRRWGGGGEGRRVLGGSPMPACFRVLFYTNVWNARQTPLLLLLLPPPIFHSPSLPATRRLRRGDARSSARPITHQSNAHETHTHTHRRRTACFGAKLPPRAFKDTL